MDSMDWFSSLLKIKYTINLWKVLYVTSIQTSAWIHCIFLNMLCNDDWWSSGSTMVLGSLCVLINVHISTFMKVTDPNISLYITSVYDKKVSFLVWKNRREIFLSRRLIICDIHSLLTTC